MAYDAAQLLEMTAQQLDDLFKASPAGDIPDGAAKGTAIIAPGTKISERIAEIASGMAMNGIRVSGRTKHAYGFPCAAAWSISGA